MNQFTQPLLSENAIPPSRLQGEPLKPDWYTDNMDLCSQLADVLHLDSSQKEELTEGFEDFNDALLNLIKDMQEVGPRWLASASTNKASKKMVEEGPKKVERLARKMAAELKSTVLNTDNSAFEKTIMDQNNQPAMKTTKVPPAEQAKRNFEATKNLESYFTDLTKLTDEYFKLTNQADKELWDRIKFSVKLIGAMASAYGVGKALFLQELIEISQENSGL